MNDGFRQPAAVATAWGWLRAHPWWAVSIAAHAALVVGVLAHRGTPLPMPGRPVLSAADQARVDASLERARRLQMQKHLRSLEAIERELAGAEAKPPGPDEQLPDDPQALLQRAREAATRIEQAEQRRRAEELARLTGLPPHEALGRVKAQPPAQPAPKPGAPAPTPEQALRDLERHAREVQARRAQDQARQQEGTRVAGAAGSARDPSTARPAGGGGGTPSAQPGTQPAGDGVRGVGRGAPGDERAGGPLLSTMAVEEPRVYGVMRQSQLLDAATLRPAHARRLGAGAPLATRVLPDGWYVVGPFAARGSRSLHDPYPPETAVDLDGVYVGQQGRLVAWRWVPVSPYPLVPPDRAEDAVYYAWTEVHVDRDQDVVLEIGADDDSKLWLNDRLVWESDGQVDKPWYRQPFYRLDRELGQLNLVEGRKLVRLRAGRNTLLLKLYNGIDLSFFSVVLTAPG